MTHLYTLKEVAERTGFALRSLERDARAGKFTHVHRGRERFMTEAQIEELIERSTKRPSPAGPPPAGEMKKEKLIAELRRRKS